MHVPVFETLATGALLTAAYYSGHDLAAPPSVHLQNGSYHGLLSHHFQQDWFLGVPYAQPPVGALRFQNPQPLNTTWPRSRNATQYSPQCYGYGPDTWVLGNDVSEDCLTLNVIRPRGVAASAKLPVAVYIHGGAYLEGGSSDPRYNMTYMVQQGVRMHKPLLGVSLNYRLHGFGFLYGSAIQTAGVANLALKDQRLALHWIHENIAAFGGDPAKVTIFGESAGGGSVENQLLAYGGRDEGLFRGAVAQSMWKVRSTKDRVNATTADVQFDRIAEAAGCKSARDALECLRHVPVKTLSDVFNSSIVNTDDLFPVIDGEFLPESDVMLLAKGKFVRVPLLHGQNADEGSSFGVKGVNTEDEFIAYLRATGRTEDQATFLSRLYPDVPAIGVPSTLHERPAVGSELGAMYKRVSAYAGDVVMHAGRRWMSQAWSQRNVPVFAYNFDVLTNGQTPADGSSHFQDVVFVFDDVTGNGYGNVVRANPLKGKPKAYFRLANLMSRMWVNFVVDQTPNHSGVSTVEWPMYSNDDPQILVFDTNVTHLAYVAPDTYRAEAIVYIQSLYN